MRGEGGEGEIFAEIRTNNFSQLNVRHEFKIQEAQRTTSMIHAYLSTFTLISVGIWLISVSHSWYVSPYSRWKETIFCT